ncbi:MAG TPA: hypothetical protein VD794_03065 [Flavisolibacter sp.]|nr:hypothetical protein [Flavisolibacter sp.]
MNKIDLLNLGGFPFEQDTIRFMQDSYGDMFSSLANLLGDKVILSGVQVINGQVTDGWITYQGEIIKFVGGAAGGEVIILETAENATFEDGNERPVYKTKVATIGGPGGFPFADLKPANVGVPSGTVVMWSGSVNAIPAGWQLHAPLAGKFIVGYDPNDGDYNAVGKTGGAKTTTFQWENLPAQTSGPVAQGEYGLVRRSKGGEGWTVDNVDADNSGNEPDLVSPPQKINLGGKGTPLDRRPTYYTLAYIIKL